MFTIGCSGETGAPNFKLPGGAAGSGAATAATAGDPSQTKPGAANQGKTTTNGSGDPLPGDPSAAPVSACAQRSLPEQPLRRLSSAQFNNSLRDLFGDELAAPMIDGSLYPLTAIESGFTNDAEANIVNTEESNAIEDNAARIAKVVMDDPESYLAKVMPCEIAEKSQDDDLDACIDQFIDEFGLRAYRRPLTDDERELTRDLYDALRADQPAAPSFAALVQLFVESPAMLYRVERGGDAVGGGMVKLTDYEMASRLSFFFRNSMPDEALFAAAKAGKLSTKEQVADQARRLMAEPRFGEVLTSFHRDWLRLYLFDQSDKDADRFPELTPAVRAALREESRRLVMQVWEEGDGRIGTLLGGSVLPLNSTLAEFYGVKAKGADEETWVETDVPNRRGLLTQASFMAAHAGAERTSPIHRGAFFQREVLCRTLPPFPGNIDTKGPLMDASGEPTARGRLAPLLVNQPCAGCHTQFNPTGLAFENYDAIGRWRDTENDATIDGSGQTTIDGNTIEFQNPLEFTETVAESAEIRDCYATQWFRSVLGRREFAEDACSLETLKNAVADSDGDLRELMVALTQTDAFMYRKQQEENP